MSTAWHKFARERGLMSFLILGQSRLEHNLKIGKPFKQRSFVQKAGLQENLFIEVINNNKPGS
jgi:hypothetical protein